MFFIFEKYFFMEKENYQDKIHLLTEMIAFALIDGDLNDREYDFLANVAQEMQISKETFLALFENRNQYNPIKDEFERICQFYRLSLLMQCDGILHEKEYILINELGIRMGLNPYAMKRVLKYLEKSNGKPMPAEKLLAMFTEQLN
jgi:hypothetical protein